MKKVYLEPLVEAAEIISMQSICDLSGQTEGSQVEGDSGKLAPRRL